ncbi:MarR family transcriptional regulator [Salibacteraceae bacterium]|jgi:MarR family transcriptional regulator for hemolysin|nr:MarR family transcriptional regulator [Salibacteraceae bacterium]MDA9967783.1 MarR family transcriptional regulator [Salibacteraceae bacterium]
MKEEKLDSVIYFLMDKTMRISKKYSLKRLQEEGFNITIDQWVILLRIHEEKQQTQVELASAVNKDTASVTRILDLLHDKKLVRRVPNESDKRKSALVLTNRGTSYVKEGKKVVTQIREEGLKGITRADVEITNRVLKQMAINMA